MLRQSTPCSLLGLTSEHDAFESTKAYAGTPSTSASATAMSQTWRPIGDLRTYVVLGDDAVQATGGCYL